MNVFDRGWDPAHGYQVPSERIFAAGTMLVMAAMVIVVSIIAGGVAGALGAL